MTSLILRACAPPLTALMLLFSAFVTLRGHNDPGGGFIGGLVAASALAIHAIAFGGRAVRRALKVPPEAVAAVGLALAAASGLVSLPAGRPFFTGLWWFPGFLDEVGLSTPLVFDLGVYLVVAGTLTAVALALGEGEAGR